jgi:hypothetical protein
MATTSRTYLASDWQVWTYAPVAGKFRLNYSTLNGTDVLGGATDTGSMTVLNMDINSINISDGERPSQAVFGSVNAATAAISLSSTTWDANVIKELYAGKAIAITLKNQASVDIDVYGRNSVFFLGTIASSNYDVDPVNEVTTFNIEAVDIFSNALNQQIGVAKSTTASKASVINTAISTNSNLFDSHLSIGSNIDLTAQYEVAGTELQSLGAWLADYIETYVAIPVGYYYLNGTTLTRNIDLNALHVKPTSGSQITDGKVTAIQMATDGDDIPTSFNLSNASATYTAGNSMAGILTQPIDYTSSIDVNGTAQLQQIADRISSYTPALSPTSITVKTATTYQTITFDDTQAQSAGKYYYPTNWWANGTDVDIYLAYLGNVHYYTRIIGQEHEITPDYWLTTYHLLKGR